MLCEYSSGRLRLACYTAILCGCLSAGREDIDLYRGAAYTQGTIKYYYRPPAILHADSWCSGDVSSHAGVA